MNETAHTDLQTLPPNQCWDLLRTADLGRLAVVSDGCPDIFPVNYIVDHGAVVVRTAEGAKLSALLSDRAFAFEVDGRDGDVEEYCWSVVLRGQATPISGLYDAIDSADLPLRPSHSGSKSNYLELVPTQITGRRFIPTDPATVADAAVRSRRVAAE